MTTTPTAGEQIVHARGLTRDFVVRSGGWRRTKRVVRAVVDLDLDIVAGEAVGYIGANGAGKSTTIKMLTGILSPSQGTVRTCGYDPRRSRRALAREIGVVFGQRSQLWWDLPLRESYRVLAAIHRLGPGHRERLDELIEALDLEAFLDTPVRQLSLGQRIRGEIAAALLHSPRLLVLDEPTIGLDVLSKERLRAFLVAERAAHGTTLLLTTHDMDDVQRLTDRIVVVDRGSVAYAGDLPGLVRRVGADRVIVLDLEEPTPPLADLPGTRLLATEHDGLRQRLALLPGSTAAAVLAEVAGRAPLRDLTIEEPDVEDVVRRLYATQRAGG
ncbi:ABC transporter ATP-binding protein [Pseudactinotalea suaedae]|uniref:ABC transporter ATP-binding protein n=1 Tax=Pseudactinotalea suaedae TaxID=1524924 RepID=UPI0012E0FD8F|nr:ATP-binding cassette domain-containing protein [Pseudactinotalea suaedae]